MNHPILPLENAVAMINMDMIGRIRDGKVYVSGTGTGSTFDEAGGRRQAARRASIDLSEKTGYGGSDHTSFTTKQVPVLFFFSGLHGDYHKPSDTSDKIDAADAAKLLDYVAQIATRLANDPERPKFVRVAEPSQSVGGSGRRLAATAPTSAASRISTSRPRASASPMCATARPPRKPG